MKLVRENINEKFTQDSDPIHDLGIGLYHKRNFNDERDIIDFLYDHLPTIIKRKNIPKDIINDTKCWIKPKYHSNFDNFIVKYILLKEKKYHKRDSGEPPIGTLHYLLHEKLKNLGYSVTGEVNEKFTQDSDPIKDMSIGLTPKQIAERFIQDMQGNIRRISQIYFGDQKHIGPASVLYFFFLRVEIGTSPQDAFFRSCESQNYYGSRPDIVALRKKIADVIKDNFNIEVNWTF
jgi:hypothetical protein